MNQRARRSILALVARRRLPAGTAWASHPASVSQAVKTYKGPVENMRWAPCESSIVVRPKKKKIVDVKATAPTKGRVGPR